MVPSVTLSGRDLIATGTAAADSYLLRIGPTGYLEMFENDPAAAGRPAFTGKVNDLRTVSVTTFDGTDEVIVDFVNGNPVPEDGLSADTGTTRGDRLTVRGSSGFSTEVYTPTGRTAGTIVLDHPATRPTRITYAGVQLIDDTLAMTGTPAEGLTFNATSGNDGILVANGAALSGLPTTRLTSSSLTFTQLTFVNKSSLTLHGQAGNDTITLDNPVPAAGLGSMQIYAGAGSDTVNVRGTAAGILSTYVQTAGGATAPAATDSDTVNVGSTANSLDGLTRAVMVEADPTGASTLAVNDQGDGDVNDYTLTGSSVSRAGAATVTFSPLGTLQVNAGTNNDTIHVLGTDAAIRTAVDAGLGNDTTLVGDGTLEALKGWLDVYGRDGTNTITFDDSGSTTRGVYDLTHVAFYRANAPITGILHYFQMQSLDVFTGNQDDVIFAVYTALGCNMALHAGAGHDSVEVGGAADSLNRIDGPLTVHGDANGTRLSISDDAAATVGRSYSLAANSLSWGGATVPQVTYDGVDDLALTGGGGNDAFTVQALPAAPALIDGGAGDDTLTGPNLSNSWEIGSLVAGRDGVLDHSLGFVSVRDLVGNAGNDVFAFVNNGSLAGRVDGGGGLNTLDYTADTRNLLVSLLAGTADGVGLGISAIRNVKGGRGEDILVGNAENNRLEGGPGRDILIGREGEDTLLGGTEDDILIGGMTAHDASTSALNDIRREWTRRDIPMGQFTERINHLRGLTAGLNGSTYLNGTTIFQSGVNDLLTGGDGQDWFWVGNPQDFVRNVDARG